ncbi:hypothetical protein OFDDKENP_00193 [Aeromonas phage B614]|nr:hypothetical protein OFDDKENP_00193 [Aeromonas phage B614]UYD58330.1 hypothetical protein JNEOFJEA_00251 [Aeromonas phage UP87]UYD58444.1 hypothetical protein IPAKJDPM_00101 [Aeromonas phage avDM14-QBC]UYD58660.1 hypothetical protein HNNIDBEH_00067 [Aeromonas phage avDM10-HWA]UYD59037.1 hypothetical protein OFOPOMKI_00187 [Aeromonas phage avDM7-IJDJ]UYD59849.1 hypothetical protein LEHPIFIF_00076 [Aeromonas phage avDM9-HANS]
MNPVAKNDFNRGGAHVDRKRREKESNRKQKHKKDYKDAV